MNKTEIKVIMAGVLLVLVIALGSAHEHNFTETKKLVDLGISCDKLTDEQLEAIGDYYMEQMHPGEAHELMDDMMGGEGSESLRQVHINMAKRIYCNEDVGGMMPIMMDMMSDGNMMNSGGMMGEQNIQSGMMQGITGNYYIGYNVFGWLFMVLVIIVLVLLIIWLIKQLTKNTKDGKRKK